MLSTIKAKYVSIIEVFKEAFWLKGLSRDLYDDLKLMALYYDSHSAFYLTKDQIFYERTKHIDIRYHWIREMMDAFSPRVRDQADRLQDTL